MSPKLPPEFLEVPLAHRGLHDVKAGRPENSRAAVRAAIDAGYGIEIDLQASRDAQAMVFHDHGLERLTAVSGPINALTAKELSDVTLRGGEEGVPTLPEILQLVSGRVPLLIEIKDQDGDMGRAVGPLENSVAKALSGYKGLVAVMSYNPHSTQRMSELCPHIPRGLVTEAFEPESCGLTKQTCEHLRDIPDYDSTKSSFVSHDWRDLKRPRVAELKARGANILCWTVKSPADEAEARKIAQNITFERYLAPFPA